MFAGRMPRFSGTYLAVFAPSVRSNLPRSQVGRSMFSRPYIYRRAPRPQRPLATLQPHLFEPLQIKLIKSV
jgi:hypothetical protein